MMAASKKMNPDTTCSTIVILPACNNLSYLLPQLASLLSLGFLKKSTLVLVASFVLVGLRQLIPVLCALTPSSDFTYLKTNMYPIAKYSASDVTNIYWFHWTQVDLAYLHAILYTTSFFFDDLAGRKSERTKYHSYRTVSELNKQLCDPQTALTDSTTTVVMFMLFITECFGDMESAHMHMMGLKRIIDLRGGLKSYDEKPLLQEKIRR